MTRHHSSSNPSGSGPFPELCVFDLDACFWDQEMYTLSHIPQETNVVRGDLMGRGEGVVGVMSGRERISLHKGSLLALQAHYHGEYPGMKVCFASSADTPLAEKIGRGECGRASDPFLNWFHDLYVVFVLIYFDNTLLRSCSEVTGSRSWYYCLGFGR
eukprot:CCRYP_016748-RA/>CCRYP_016748-RA protein AED:0.31 eAED:0.31 QI:0/-1/0/1/-1/0/1/0/157